MRRALLLGLLAIVTLPAMAKRDTVAHLEQALTAALAAHKLDPDVARQIAGIELTERFTDATIYRLNTQLHPGPEAATALQLLAEQSAFLNPPADELPNLAVPDPPGAERILESANPYVAQTLPRLPNFLATRTINRYDDSPRELKKGAWPVRAGLHLVGTSSHEISVREERENQPTTQGSAVWQQQIGLISGSEFGTTLGMILADAPKAAISFSHWEQVDAAPAAVFQYSVPSASSHFELIATLQREAAIEAFATTSVGSGEVASMGARANNNPSRSTILRIHPAYHGFLWIDPATGSILRITMEAELKASDPFRRAAILVQYGTVQIGDSRFICPVRSLAVSLAAVGGQSSSGDAPTMWLNETVFTGYHRFASTTRVITGSPPQ